MLKKFFNKQLASVIEWKNPDVNTLLYKFPSTHDEIKDASKLILAPGQGCVLVYEGRIKDVLTEPDTYNLETDNHPFVTTLLKIRQNFESEHKLKVYFFRTADVVNQYWGTASPIKYVDASYNLPVELGLNGNFSYKINQPLFLFTNIIGAQDEFSTDAMKQVIVERIINQLRNLFAKHKYEYNSIDAKLIEIEEEIGTQITPDFESLGLQLTDFNITGTLFDENTMERIGRIADITTDTAAAAQAGLSYTEMEKLRALRDAAKNEGGLAGMGAQLGVGMEIGKLFSTEKDSFTHKIAEENSDAISKLQKLKVLVDEQIITQEEFNELKKQILNNMNL
ncbi:SPFH domain-containing protein [Sphingobacterium hungaricum]|uniref:Membrane protease subunit, stomatin/prohibitin family, contains C-terminal Zn-ribbon domain n=1 Tax=Sphingobacterium hungaricum TaxID=2082723 RepID=A0A928YS19_9SPHI|nr:SPFH domain-containing protein [Sphingobacterium hungaricum]MBE8715272.1 hypothetical protein [Sphingobacterium hungaricum]